MESTTKDIVINQADRDFSQLLKFRDDPVGIRLACSDISQRWSATTTYFEHLLSKISEMGKDEIDKLFLSMNLNVEQNGVNYTSIARTSLFIPLFGAKDDKEAGELLTTIFGNKEFENLTEVIKNDFDNIIFPFKDKPEYTDRIRLAKNFFSDSATKTGDKSLNR